MNKIKLNAVQQKLVEKYRLQIKYDLEKLLAKCKSKDIVKAITYNVLDEITESDKNITLYVFNNNSIRFFRDHFNRPLFHTKDVKKFLNLKTKDVEKFSQKILINGETVEGIEETDLYYLMVISKNKTAKKFSNWLFQNVVPTIRKTGEYNQFFVKEVLNSIQ